MVELQYRALALDLDGTLTDSQKRLPEKNKEAIWKAVEKGTTIILASGRPTMGVVGIADELELDKRGGIIVAYNGGEIINCKTGEKIQNLLLPAVIIPEICRISKKYGVYPLSYTKDQIVAESDTDEYVLKECKCNSTTVLKVESLADFLDYPVVKVLVTGEHEILLQVKAELEERYLEEADFFFSESYFLEVVPKGVAKDQALKKVCEYLKITREELMACGDGLNDVPMFRYAGLSVGMRNGYAEALETVDYISPYTNDEFGVAHAIDKFILQG